MFFDSSWINIPGHHGEKIWHFSPRWTPGSQSSPDWGIARKLISVVKWFDCQLISNGYMNAYNWYWLFWEREKEEWRVGWRTDMTITILSRSVKHTLMRNSYCSLLTWALEHYHFTNFSSYNLSLKFCLCQKKLTRAGKALFKNWLPKIYSLKSISNAIKILSKSSLHQTVKISVYCKLNYAVLILQFIWKEWNEDLLLYIKLLSNFNGSIQYACQKT